MRETHLRALALICSWSRVITANEVVYVTDLSIFTYLAPCAASAVSYNIQSQTYSHCPEAVTDLKSCVCTKDNNFASIATEISSSVSYSCGFTATDDQASAETVLSAYCDQNSLPSFPVPTSPVSQFITDVAEFQYLAPCAASGLSYAVQSMTYNLCPADATALATCVCEKNQNSLAVSQSINSNVKYSCSSHSADITSAQGMFAAYCSLNAGVSSFPSAASPPGDMSYYITALTQFASLAPCAASAVSRAVFAQTYDLCPNGPQDLASCACIKESMSGSISSSITSNVKWSCDSTATADISSALAVFDFYCSAANNEAVASGVTDSVSQTEPTAKSGSNAGSGPKATGTSGGLGSGSSQSENSSGSSSNNTSNTNTAAIVGAVVGVVVVAIIGTATYFMIRQRRNKLANNSVQYMPNGSSPGGATDAYTGKPELAGAAVSAAPAPPSSPHPSTLKASTLDAASPRAESVSPVSAHGSAFGLPPHKAELQGQGHAIPPVPSRPELQGQNTYSQPASRPDMSELQGQSNFSRLQGQVGPGQAQEAYGRQIYEAGGQQRPTVHQTDGRPVQPPQAELQGGGGSGSGMGWQSGPVQQQYHEMEGDYWRQAR